MRTIIEQTLFLAPVDCGSKIAYASKLTKREYFAGLAMQALISNSSIVPRIQPDNGKDLQLLSTASISIADELLNQLQK